MLNVYICDDEEPIRKELEKIVQNEILIQGYDMKLARSSANPEEILSSAKASGHSSIYFLDVELKGQAFDGFELGKRIRDFDPQGTIIYITAFGNLAYRTFEYHIGAMDYIVKNNPQNMKTSLSACLAEVVKRLKTLQNRKPAEYFTIQFMDKIRHIPLEEIYYFETSARPHHIILYAQKEQIEFPGKLSVIEKQLGFPFFRTHRAFLVNTEQIEELDLKNNLLMMKNKSSCLVSRGRKNKLRELLLTERTS